MKISVILPTRNRIKCLKKCLYSLEEQTEQPDEVIVIGHVDDVATKNYIKSLSSNLKINYLETDGGSCKSRNMGIKFASGEILIFIDDDSILEMNYVKNLKEIFENKNVDVLVGYTFDIVDLTTLGLIKNGEIEYVKKNRDDPFFIDIINEIKKRKGNLDLLNKNDMIIKNFIVRYLRIIVKSIILLEWPIKGKILPSGWRSEMPDIRTFGGLKKVEWFWANNFAIKKDIVEKFQFNEDIEIHPYALGEDLELSARIGRYYDIFLSKEIMVFHLRSQGGVRVDNREKFKALIITFYRIAKLRGNMFAFWWGVAGLTVSRIVTLPFSRSIAISEIKGIMDGTKVAFIK